MLRGQAPPLTTLRRNRDNSTRWYLNGNPRSVPSRLSLKPHRKSLAAIPPNCTAARPNMKNPSAPLRHSRGRTRILLVSLVFIHTVDGFFKTIKNLDPTVSRFLIVLEKGYPSLVISATYCVYYICESDQFCHHKV